MTRSLAIALAIALMGCSKKDPSGDPAGSGSATVASSASSTTAVTAADAAAGAKGEAGSGAVATSASAKASYHGPYSAKAGGMYIPEHKDWNNVKFKNDESKLTGDGDLTLDVDGTRVSGQTESGAIGAAIIEGTLDGSTITANVRRKDPADQGLMGTLVAKVAGDKIEGTMRLSDANAAAVREVTFTAMKK
ncbi:MAG: hypothetical protein JST00_27050 [Deltaproteobacteria bacterium]|nr:hypothetical protein [Deltaproteobacteria bacterium]